MYLLSLDEIQCLQISKLLPVDFHYFNFCKALNVNSKAMWSLPSYVL